MAASNALLSLLLLFLSFTTLSCIIATAAGDICSSSGDISVYWGLHNAVEGTLLEACESRRYNIVIIGTLDVFDDGRTPVLSLSDHCGSSSNPCDNLEPVIERCQGLGIKVFLSLRKQGPPQPTTTHHAIVSTSSSENADVTGSLAKYLWENFLSGMYGPLGAVSLDGIDIQGVADGPHLHWDELVILLNASSTTGKRIYISASPQCVYPDRFLDAAIRTGHVDFIWVEFFWYSPCIYSKGNPEKLLEAWDTWTSKVPKSLIFLGLTADNATSGYIEPHVLRSTILPIVKRAQNYGGVMISDRYYEVKKIDYSGNIKDSVRKTCRCVCGDDLPGFTGFSIATNIS